MSVEPLLHKDHKDYRVGWICALPKEQTAAIAMLDMRHANLSKPATDPNSYTLGSIGGHNIVIACLPKGKYGTILAATVATHMASTFPAIRFGLMVGIGGGIPPKVRLGDVVVSVPTDQHPGVVQWDMGKSVQGGAFKRTGALNNPPTSLLTALTKLETEQAMNGSKIPEYLNELAQKYPRLAKDYLKSESLKDILFKATCHHTDSNDRPDNYDGDEVDEELEDDEGEEGTGEDCRYCDLTQAVKRRPRDMKIHYGLIASGNQVIKDAVFRGSLVKELGGNILCVEMEAAGLMDNFPCIVVRGICDYADSHKSKAWQEHAAAVAAAFTKELLGYVTVDEVAGEKAVKDILSHISQAVISIREDTADTKQLLNKKEDMEILTWLSIDHYGAQQSDFLSRWHPKTGQWFLNADEYQDWLQKKGKMLYCPGIPGAGKTIMASAAIHNISHYFSTNADVGLAYIYFTFSRQRQQTVEHVLASLLMQLLCRQSSLPNYIRALYEYHKKNGTRPTHAELSTTLSRVVSGHQRAFVVLDALDECTAESQCRGKILTEIMDLRVKSGVNILATSRMHDDIASRFSRQDTVTLPILARDQDIGVVLRSQMEAHDPELFDGPFRDIVISKVFQLTEGMFLLAQLHLNALIRLPTKGKIKRALEGLATGPSGLYAVYELTMERIESQGNGYDELAKMILSWIVHARRPLSTLEIRHALGVELNADKIDEDWIPTVKTLKSVCAGLVTVDEESGTIRLIHYTTQEYLEQTRGKWFQDAQQRITQICVTYLSFESFNGHCETDEEFEKRLTLHPFYNYAAHEWGHHARASSAEPKVIEFLQKQDQVQGSSQTLLAVERWPGQPAYSQAIPGYINGLHLAANFGLHYATETLLGIYNADEKDSYGRPPLLWAARNGHIEVVRLLVETGIVDIDGRDEYGWTPLSRAAENGHIEVVKLLVETGKVDIDRRDEYGRTPLSRAAEDGHIEVVKLLVETGKVDIDGKDEHGLAPLLWAARNRHIKVVKLLVETGKVDIDGRDEYGQTPLLWAVKNGHIEMVNLLVETGKVDIDGRDKHGRTPLLWAAENGHIEVVKLLVETGKVDIDRRDEHGQTSLSRAAKNGYIEVVKLLVETGKVDIDGRDDDDQTALIKATKYGSEDIVLILLASGADISIIDRSGLNALQFAVLGNHESVENVLVSVGALLDDAYGLKALFAS